MSAILAQSALAFMVVKYAGVAYLVYLGARTILSREDFVSERGEESARASTRKIFGRGVLSNVLNPNVALFFLSFLPQFVTADGSALQFVLLGGVFAMVALTLTTAIAWFSGMLGEWVRINRRLSDALRWACGGVLGALGVRIALLEW